MKTPTAQHSNNVTINGVSQGRGYLFDQPMAYEWSLQETCVKTVIILWSYSDAELTQFSMNYLTFRVIWSIMCSFFYANLVLKPDKMNVTYGAGREIFN